MESLRGAGLDVTKILLLSRDYLTKVLRKRNPECLVNEYERVDDELLMVNGRLVLDKEGGGQILRRLGEEGALVQNGELVAARIKERTYEDLKESIGNLSFTELVNKLRKEDKVAEVSGFKLFKYPWELVIENTEILKEDLFERVKGEESRGLPSNVSVIGDEKLVFVSEGVEIEPYVVFNVKAGPVFIDKNVYIQAGARIEGPTYIGEDTIVIGGAQIREGSNIGPVCRVGGELEESVIHGYTNKYHYGFIGHAYVGEWVNLGAGTTNSDLKNTYGTVKVTVRGKPMDTGLLKVGCTIGDMAKTSIGVLIYTGKKIGFLLT